jgi:hypothetical protein
MYLCSPLRQKGLSNLPISYINIGSYNYKIKAGILMRSLAVFAVFFTIFLVSSLIIADPLFPGNVVCMLLNVSEKNQTSFMSAAINGMVYGFIAWIVYFFSFRWIERSLSTKTLTKEKE